MRDDVQDMIQDLFDDGYMIDVQDDIDLSLLRIVHAMAAKLKQQERSLNILGNMPDRVRSMQDALVQYSEHMKASDRLNAQLDTKVGEINSHPPGLSADDIAKGQELKAGLETYAARSIQHGKRLTKLETSDDEHRKAHDLLTEWGQYVEEKLNAVHKEVSQTRKDIDTLYGYSDRNDTLYSVHDTSLQTLHSTVKGIEQNLNQQEEDVDTMAEALEEHTGELEKLTEEQKGHEGRMDILSNRLSELVLLHDTSPQTLHATVKEQGERLDVLAERLRTQHERQDVHNGRILNIDVRLNKELERLTDEKLSVDHALQLHHYRIVQLETKQRIAQAVPPEQNSEEWPPKPAFRDNMTKLERESIQRLRNIVDRDISEYGPKSGPKYWEPLPPFNKVMTAKIADPPELSPNEAQKLREEIDQLKKETREAFQDSEDRFDSMNQRMRNYTGRLTLLTDGLDETLANEHDVQEALELARAARLTPKEESGIIAKVSHKTKRELKMLYSDIDARLMLLAKSIDELREGENVTPTKSLDKKYPYRPHSQIEQRTTGDNGAGLLTDKQRDKPKWNPAVPARPAPSDQDMDDELDTTG